MGKVEKQIESQIAEIKSPFTGGEVVLKSEPAKIEFRGEEYEYLYYYYMCMDTKLTFTTDEIDNHSLSQVYNQYRQRHGIPSCDEIKKIRTKYGLTAKAMSLILGLGENQYRLYEEGKIPSEASGKLIIASSDANTMMLLLEKSRGKFNDSEYKKYYSKISEVLSKEFEIENDNIKPYQEIIIINYVNLFQALKEFRFADNSKSYSIAYK